MASPWKFERIGEHHWRVLLHEPNLAHVDVHTEEEAPAVADIPVLSEQIAKGENPSRDKVESAVRAWRANNFPSIPSVRPLEDWLKERPLDAADKGLDRVARPLIISRIEASQRDRRRT